MVTQGQIEAKGFVWYDKTDRQLFAEDSNVYIALGTQKTGDERVRPIILRHYTDDIVIIEDFFNDPKLYRETYFGGPLLESAELDAAIDGLKWTISAIDLTKLKTDYA